MSRPVAIYSDPFEGLHAQLVEMRGLIKLVPPLIAADRQKRWDEIGSRPWNGEDDEIVDIYEVEAGPEEGHGWADYEYVVYQAAIVTSWETFHFYLTRQLARAALQYDLSDDPALAQLVVEERKTWDRRFDQVQKRFKTSSEQIWENLRAGNVSPMPKNFETHLCTTWGAIRSAIPRSKIFACLLRTVMIPLSRLTRKI